MATQEPNVYAGLSVVVGGLMHARPRFFAKVMGELLFWVGEDKMLFGSDYAIWEPKWQIEGFSTGTIPDDTFSDYPRWTNEAKRKILGPQRRQALRHPGARGAGPAEARRARRPDDAQLVEGAGVTLRAQVAGGARDVIDPELDEPITTLGFVGSCVVSDAGDVDVHLRLPTPQCAPNFAFLMAIDARDAVARLPEVGDVTVVLDDHYTGAEINAAVGGGGAFADAFPGEETGALDELRELFRRKALLARQGRVCDGAAGGGWTGRAVSPAPRRPPRGAADAERCVTLRAELGLPHDPDSPALVSGDGAAIPAEDLTTWLRRARLVGLSLESNGGLCRSLLRVRHGVPDPTEEVAA